jgi:SAM-dependent methyltransferase
MPEDCRLTLADVLQFLGTSEADGAIIAEEFSKYDFGYRRLAQGERDALILGILKKLDAFTQVGEHRKHIWEMAWSDVAKRYAENQGRLADLEPSFVGGTGQIRLQGDYAIPLDKKFELNFFRVIRTWLFRKYLRDTASVYEFGCGSGYNLAALAEMAPEKRLVGLDWAVPAVGLINEVAAKYGFKLEGRQFDFFHPDENLTLEPGAGVMTFCALEQTGAGFTTFIDWLLRRRPGVVISMEPMIEFYDRDSLVDDLAIRYHEHRKYLNGYYSYVARLAEQSKVEILKAKRLGLGSLYHEGYSLLIWRPV